MSSRHNKPVAEKGHSGPKAFDVQRTSAQGAVCITETAASKAGVSTPFTFSESSPAHTDIDELIAAELVNDPAFPNLQPSDQPLDNEMEELHVELEVEIEDTAHTYVHSPMGGQGQNEMLQEWSEKWSQLFLSELYQKYDSPENAPCLCAHPEGDRFHCDDCVTSIRYCSKCLKVSHVGIPMH
ncbi:hypothetical protein FRC11_006865 [Ceratobasidium sp. 423]|nr:hypothetical protein FRC11_006865 [Ceratobasidium sp. 423]